MKCSDLIGDPANTPNLICDANGVSANSREIFTLPTTNNIFVIMPFSSTTSLNEEEWTETYEHVFKPAVLATGYACSRAEVSTGNLIGSIVEDLRTARIVLADITDQNANVFYELGVRHALSKRTIIVSQKSEDIPSDLRGYWTFVYGRKPKEVKDFADNLARIIARIEANPEKADSPVGEILERDNVSVLAVVQRENAKKLTALFTEISGNIAVLKDAETNSELTSQLFTSCLDLLLQTLYVDLGPETLRQSYEAMYSLRRIIARAGKVPAERIAKAIQDLQSVSEAVFIAREKLIKGKFSEPTTLSTLVWVNAPARFKDEGIAVCAIAQPFDFGLGKRS